MLSISLRLFSSRFYSLQHIVVDISSDLILNIILCAILYETPIISRLVGLNTEDIYFMAVYFSPEIT